MNARYDPASLAEQLAAGNRRALARAITLVESTRAEHRTLAVDLLQRLHPSEGGSIRVGISGVPGVGKSTFIEALGMHLLGRGHRMAVLAVDPSSSLSGGSILGDKTRMEQLARHPAAFIRPSPNAGGLGGVARRTRESISLCEAAGFDVILVETVGVGQSETTVAEMTDLFLLLLLPAAGDDLQGIKRGIMELVDILLINKADGELIPRANHSAADYRSALTLLHPRTPGWRVPVETCSALSGEGIAKTWKLIGQYRAFVTDNGLLQERRAQQARSWMWSEIAEGLMHRFRRNPEVTGRIGQLEAAVVGQRLPPALAAAELLDLFKGGSENEQK